jgi:integrase
VRLSQRDRLGNGDHGKSSLARCQGYAARLGVSKLAPHELRRSCARFCHDSGGELEQIQFLLGHVSDQTTEVPGLQAGVPVLFSSVLQVVIYTS